MLSLPLRPLLTAAGLAAVLLTLLLTAGCSTTQSTTPTSTKEGACCGGCSGDTTLVSANDAKFEQDRAAILGMAGEYVVSFNFQETLGLRPGYTITEPYHADATELVIVVDDQPNRIEMQHILVVEHDDEQHIVKHWRQVWQYQQTQQYTFVGRNTWQPTTLPEGAVQGTWTQSVFQVSDEPRYWGTGTWVHAHGVSTWTSNTTNRPLPRRENTKRDDYHIVVATNTHIVTPAGWIHQQDNAKLDLDPAPGGESPVIALEQGTNTYTRTTDVDFAVAYDYWENTSAYWQNVRAAWADLLDERETIALKKMHRGDPMYNHLFDLADEYWGDTQCADAQERAAEVIHHFTTAPAATE